MTPQQRAEKMSDRDFILLPGYRLRELIAAEMEAYASERMREVNHCSCAVVRSRLARICDGCFGVLEHIKEASEAVDCACKKCNRAFAFYCAECFEGEIQAAVEEAVEENCWAHGAKVKAEAYEDAAKMLEAEASRLRQAASNDGIQWTKAGDLVEGAKRLLSVSERIRARAADLGPMESPRDIANEMGPDGDMQ